MLYPLLSLDVATPQKKTIEFDAVVSHATKYAQGVDVRLTSYS